jgi:signal peptide peptidase SppA
MSQLKHLLLLRIRNNRKHLLMSQQKPLRLIEWMSNQIWAITPDMLGVMQEIAHREGNLEAVMAMRGQPLEHSSYTTMRGSTAVIDVIGPISRYGSFFSMISGGCNVETLAKDFTGAINSGGVQRIVLNIDSPGGAASGVQELASMIRNLSMESGKEVIGYVSDRAASGGYWIAAACSKIICSPSAMLGCIGVVATFRSTQERDEKNGVVYKEIVSSLTPFKRPDPFKSEGEAQYLKLIDSVAQQFIESVADFRGFTGSLEEKAKLCGEGLMFVGQEAVEAGLADAVGSLESILKEPAAHKPMPGRSLQMSTANQEGPTAGERLAAFFTGLINGNSEPPKVEAAAETQVQRFEDTPAYKEGLKKLQVQAKGVFETATADFIAQQKNSLRVMPAEEHLISFLMNQLYEDDLRAAFESPQLVGEGAVGVQVGSRVEAFKALIQKRTPHSLTGERLAAVLPDDAAVLDTKDKTPNSGLAEGTPSAERLARLKSLTPLGLEVLKDQNGNGKH